MESTELAPQMNHLLARVKKEMNGAVVEAMNHRGICYPLSYGVSVPTIRQLAATTPPSHALALLLFEQGIRESMLLATYVDRSEWVTRDQMELWADSFLNTEIVEHLATHLFALAPDALPQALEWIVQSDPLRLYAGLLMLSKIDFRALSLSEDQLLELVNCIDHVVLTKLSAQFQVRGIVAALLHCARGDQSLSNQLRANLIGYQNSADPLISEVASEMDWRLAYH